MITLVQSEGPDTLPYILYSGLFFLLLGGATHNVTQIAMLT